MLRQGESRCQNTSAVSLEFLKLETGSWHFTLYSLISEKAVINVVRTYHVLANLHFPKTLYHLTKTVLFLAGHVTHSEYQRYLALNEEFNGVRLHTYQHWNVQSRRRRRGGVFESRSSTSRAHKSHQTHVEHFLGTRCPMSYLPQCSREHSSLKLKRVAWTFCL